MLVALSDTHLTHRFFSSKKFHYLSNVIQRADQIVIVGDFWDGRRCTFNQFIRSRWRGLFPMLKSRNSIYLYGNNDPKELCSQEVNLFSVQQAESLDLQIGTLNLHFEHGHRIAPNPIDEKYPWIMEIPGMGYADYLFNELIPTSLFGERWINLRGAPAAKLLRARARNFAAQGQWLICGHSHITELDPNIRYANCGFFGMGYAQYLKIGRYSIGPVNGRY